jgi:hypothetical protein
VALYQNGVLQCARSDVYAKFRNATQDEERRTEDHLVFFLQRVKISAPFRRLLLLALRPRRRRGHDRGRVVRWFAVLADVNDDLLGGRQRMVIHARRLRVVLRIRVRRVDRQGPLQLLLDGHGCGERAREQKKRAEMTNSGGMTAGSAVNRARCGLFICLMDVKPRTAEASTSVQYLYAP